MNLDRPGKVGGLGPPSPLEYRLLLASPRDERPNEGTKRPMQLNDLQSVNACLAGQPEAFAELVRRYQDRLYGALYRVLRNPQDTQDCVQDAFLLAYQSLRSFRQSSDFYTWLYRIAMNAAMSMRRKRRPLTGLDPLHGPFLGTDLADDSPHSQPGAALEEAEEMQQLERALGRLSTSDRALLVMKSVEGHSYQTIAEVLGIPFGTVRSRLHRARMKLRRVVGDLSGHPERF
jgi:RNA polymerase sigma-70 factor (ECF subfamily)